MSVFQATLVGTPSAIDVKKNSWNTSSKTKFVGTGLQSINIKFVGDSTLYFCYVNKIEIYVGGSLWRTVTFYGGDILWQTCNYYIFKSNKANPFYGAKDNIDIGLYETKTYISGNPYAMSDAALSTEPQFTTAGSKSITAKIYYQYHMGEGFPGYGSQLSSWQTETISCGSVSVLNPYCERITLSGGKREFYAPEQFDYSTLVVTGYYRYAADGGLAYTAAVTGYEISNPSYLFSVAQNSQGASGYVTVTYSGRTASYEISVYGVKRYTAPTARSSRNTPYFRLGEQHTLAQSTITYGDDTTETETPSVSGFSTAAVTAEGQSATASYSIYADKTQKAYSWDEQYKVLPMYLTLDVSNVQRNFDADDDLSASGLVVLAHYGYDNNEERDLAGVDNIPLNDPNLTITFPLKKPGANKTVTVTYSNGHDQASATYSININGIYDVDIDISAYKNGLQVERNGTVSFGLATAMVRRYSNGVLSDWVPYSGAIYAKQPVDTSVEGKTDITLYVQENGAYAEQAFPLEVYGIVDIQVSLPTQFYYEGADYPTINFSKIKAYAKKTTDGLYAELSYNAAANGYEAVIGGVVQTESEITLTEDTLITIRSKADNSIYTEALVRVTEKAAVADAPLVVYGDVQYVSAGEEIDKTRFSVYQQMNDGTLAQITDFDCVISGKSGLTFGAGDAVGQSYDLVFSKSPSASKTVQNAAFLDGVRSIDNVSIAKTVYDIGDQFNASEISCTVNYYHAESRDARFRVGTDTCAKTAFAAADAGEQSIPLTLYGQQAYVQVTVRKVVSLVKVDGESPTYGGYRIHDPLDPSGHGYSFRKVYDHEIDGEDTYDLSDSEVSFAFSGAGAGCSAADLIPSLASQQITVTPSYTENGFTVSCDSYSIYAKRLKSISLIDSNAQQVSKLHMDKGNALDLSPYRLHVEFNNGDVLNIEAQSADSADPANGAIISDAVIGAAIGYTFVRNDSLTATYDIHVHYVSEIQTNLNTAIAASYYTGSVIDLTAITASRVISSTDQEEIGYPLTQQFTPRLTLDSMSVEGTFQLSVAGNHTLSFADSGITKSVTFSVVSTALSSIATTRSNVFKSLADYVEGQRLDLTGLSITKSYNDGTTETLSADDPNVQLVDGDGEPVSKRKEIALSDDGMELFVKISENGVTRTAAVEESNGSPVALSVAPNELDSIEILSSSTHKTTFTYGDRFSSDGMMLKATFTNGSTQGVPLQSVSFSGAAIGHEFNPTDDQTFGEKTITISYTYGGITRTATYGITLAKPVLSSITTNAASDSFVSKYVDNEVYSESGLVVTGVFANGWTSVIPNANWLTNAATVLAIDGQTGKIQMTGNYGSKTITVTATNPYDSNQASVTATYNVDVLTSGQIVSATLMFDDDVDYADYFVGDEYDAKGVYFHIADIDGNETNVRSFTTNPAVGTRLRKAQRLEISCTYVKGSFSHTATYSITVSVKDSVKFTETKDYKLAIGFMSGDLFSSIQHEEQKIALGTTESGAYYPLFHEDKVQIDTNPTHAATYGFNVYTGNDAEGDCIGYIDIGSSDAVGNVIRQAHVVLFDDPLNPIDGQGNIEVTFPHYVYGLAERINKCRFGIVYNNRLFLSGNPEYRSCDWHSGAVNVSQDEDYDRNADLDFTYFSDLDYCYYGTDETALVGYDIHRDGDLIAVKQGSRHEATLYRRSYKLVAAQAYDGSQSDSSLVEEAFPMFDINANGGVGGLSNRSILSFVGETLVLTKDGLKAITSKDSVSGTEKYSVDVSTYINPKITEEGLENAFIFACKEKMYLKTDRGVYVGYNELRNERGEYEWYFLCDLPATMFFEHDDELYFANDDGEVFRFPGGNPQYVDYDRDYIGYGGAYLTLDDVNNRIITGNAYADLIEEGKIFHLLTDFNVNGADVRTQVHASLGRFVNANHRANMLENGGVYDDTLYNGTFDPTSGVIEIKARNHDGTEDESKTIEIADMFFDGRKVKFDALLPQNQDSLELYEEYTLSRVGDRQYKIIKADGNAASLAGVVSFRMCFVVNDYKFTTIDDVQPYGNDGAKSFTLKGMRSRPLDLVYYNNQNGYYSGIVTTQHKVKSYYVTVPYSMGSISTYKTIWGWVVANDTNRTSFMDIGYITSRKQTGFKTIAKSHQLRFDGLDFSKMTMLNDSLPHVYVQYKTLPAVNFIRFVFKNEEDSNMALTALDVIYTYNGLTKGVR